MDVLEGAKDDLREVVTATMPVIALMLIVQVLVVGSDAEVILQFILSSILVITGFALFIIGVKMGTLPMGESIGAELPQRGSLPFILGVAFLLSFLVTMAEPDVSVLTNLYGSVSGGGVDGWVLTLAIAMGVGFFIVVSVLRILLGISIKVVLGLSYLSIILLSLITPADFLAISFDSGGVTTGPMTVPVIISLGVGITSVLSDRGSISDSFGLIGVASAGPIISMMLLGVFLG